MKKTSKFLITMLSLVVLFAVFAFGASAADYSGALSSEVTELVLNDGDTIGADGDLIITSPVDITVNGTVTMKSRIRIGDGTAEGVVVNIKGDDATTDILLVDSEFSTGLYRAVQVRTATMNMENVTLDVNGVAVQGLMGYNAGATINMNTGATVTGSASSVGALYGWGTYNMNSGSVVKDCTAVGVGLASGAILNLNGGSITAGTYCVVLRENTSKLNYYSGTLTPGTDKSPVVNNSDTVDGTVTAYQTWNEDADIVYALNSTSFGLSNIDKIIVTVDGQLTTSSVLTVGGGIDLTLKGKSSTASITAGTSIASGMISVSNGTGYTGTTIIVESLILDGAVTTRSSTTGRLSYSGSSERRVITLNGYTNAVLNSGAVIKGGYRSNSAGGIYVENNATLTINDGASICDNLSKTAGGIIINTSGVVTMNGGSITGNESTAAGGGVRVNGTMYMYGGTVSDNYAATYGAGVYVNNGKLYIYDDKNDETAVPTFSGNSSDRATVSTSSTYGGGAILTENASCIVVIETGNFTENTSSQNGGAIALMGGKATIYNGSFSNNIAANNNSSAGTGIGGGAIWTHTGVTLDIYPEVTFSGNKRVAADNDMGKHGSGTIIIHHKVNSVSDIIPDLTTMKTLPFYDLANKLVMEFYADITTTVRPYFGGTAAIDVVGMNIGTEEEPKYPVITKDANTSMSTSFVNIGSGAIVTMSNITFDVDLYDPNATEAPATELRAIYINSNAQLTLNSGAVIKGGYRSSAAGAGVYEATGVTFTMNEGSLITECSGKSAGGVYVANQFVMNGGSITNCVSNSGDGGAAVYVGTTGTFTMNGGTISGCSASNHGGAIFNWKGTVEIAGGTISGNSAVMGSAIRNYGPLTISGGTISENTGNGVIVSSTSGTDVTGSVTITGGTITGNKVENDDNTAGIYVVSGTLTMSNGTISDNIGGSTSEGGGIRLTSNVGDISITGGTISGNKAGYGAGIYALKVVDLSDVTITGNEAFVKGGGVYIGSSVATVNISGNTQITGNTIDGTITSNVQKNSGFKSYDDEAYADNNWPNGWLVVNGEFTGSVGVYFEALPIDMTFDEIKLGVIADGGIVSGTISNDNGKFTYAESTDANGVACISLQSANKAQLTINFADGSSQTFETPDFDFYALPSVDSLTSHTGSFLGYVKVSGFGTEDVKAEAILKAGEAVAAADLANIYATWVNINTLTSASASISDNSGIRFFTTVESSILDAVGIKVKAGNAEGDGYYRGTLLGTSATDLTTDLSKDNKKMDVKVNNTGWANAAAFNITVEEGYNAFAATITYSSEDYYNNAVAYRGYIEVTVGDTSVIIYSDFINPGTLTDSADASYAETHARSACAIVRNVYFSGAYSEKSLITELGETNYAIALKIAGYEAFPEITAANIAYYL